MPLPLPTTDKIPRRIDIDFLHPLPSAVVAEEATFVVMVAVVAVVVVAVLELTTLPVTLTNVSCG